MGPARAHPALAGAVLAVSLLAATAHAQPADREEARREFQRGRGAYDLAQYDQAIAHFTRAYQLSSEPVLIFNIAQANRLMGRCGKAIELYQQYVRLAPATEEAEAARAHLETLGQTCRDTADGSQGVGAAPAAPAAKPAPAAPAPPAAVRAAAPAAPPVVAPAGGGLRYVAWGGLAGGLLVGGASPLLYHWNQSRKAKHDVEAAALNRVLASDAADPGARMRLEQSNRALERSIDTVDVLVIVTATLGAAAVLTSSAYLVFGGRPERGPGRQAAVDVRVAAGPRAGLVVVSGRY
jgi:tetratricopeptide (TPR) repeat protein